MYISKYIYIYIYICIYIKREMFSLYANYIYIYICIYVYMYMAFPRGVCRPPKGLSKIIHLKNCNPPHLGSSRKEEDVQIDAKHEHIFKERCETRENNKNPCFWHLSSFVFFSFLSSAPCSNRYVPKLDRALKTFFLDPIANETPRLGANVYVQI